MEIVIKKKSKSAIKNRYSFPTTDEMKLKLDELKIQKGIDVNEMLRQYAEKMIEHSEKQPA